MNCPCDLTSRRLDALDVALPLERARHLDTKVDIHRLIPTFRVVIEEQVVSRVQFAIRFLARPHLIERRLPCSGDIADGHRGPDCCHQLCLRSFPPQHRISWTWSFRTRNAKQQHHHIAMEDLKRRGIQRLLGSTSGQSRGYDETARFSHSAILDLAISFRLGAGPAVVVDYGERRLWGDCGGLGRPGERHFAFKKPAVAGRGSAY